MSYHLLGDFATANSVLDTFRQSQVNVSVASFSFYSSYAFLNVKFNHFSITIGDVRLQAQ